MDGNLFDRSTLSNEATKLLDVLLEHVSESGQLQVSSSRLLRESGLTQGALVRARGELTREGLLRTKPGFSSSGLRGANVYVLDLSVLGPASGHILEDEIGRIDAEDPDAVTPPPSGEGATPSGRHRSERKGWWKKFFGRTQAS